MGLLASSGEDFDFLAAFEEGFDQTSRRVSTLPGIVLDPPLLVAVSADEFVFANGGGFSALQRVLEFCRIGSFW